MNTLPHVNLPVNINNRKYDQLRKYFGKESIHRHLRELSRESVYTVDELIEMKKREKIKQQREENGEQLADDELEEDPYRFGGNKEILAYYLEEDKKRRLRELLAQARIMHEMEIHQKQENVMKQALEQKLKREMAEKVKEFDANRQHKASFRSIEAMREIRNEQDQKSESVSLKSKKVASNVGTPRSQTKSSGTVKSQPKTARNAPSAVSRQTGSLSTKTAATSRPELGEKTPRRGDNLTVVNYTDYNGQPVPRDIDVELIDDDYLRDALWEFHTSEDWRHDENTKIDEVAISNRPQTDAGSVTTRQTSRTRMDSEYFAWASVPALKSISRSFQKSVRVSYTPRDFESIQNVYSGKLRPSAPSQDFQRKPATFPKIRLTRERIRYPPHPPKVHMLEKINTNVKLTLRYNGVPTKVVDIPEDGHKLEVAHQPGSGTTFTIFSGYVYPGKTFDIVSKRLPGHPFSITLFINGYADTRVSTCCEFRHKEGFKIGGSLGRFTVEKITGDRELRCYKCKINDFENMPKLKKLIVQDKFKNRQPKGIDEKAEQNAESSKSSSCSSSVYSGRKIALNADETGMSSNQGEHHSSPVKQERSGNSSDSESSNESVEHHAIHEEREKSPIDKTSTNYKVTLVATNLELARDSNVTITAHGTRKRFETISLDRPFSKVMKMNVHYSFIGAKMGQLTKVDIETEPPEGADWFLKEVVFEYGNAKTVFQCEKWIGISDSGREEFSNGVTTYMAPVHKHHRVKEDNNENTSS